MQNAKLHKKGQWDYPKRKSNVDMISPFKMSATVDMI